MRWQWLPYIGSAALASGCGSAASAQSLQPGPASAQSPADDGAAGTEIIVQGRRSDDRYRLPPQFRTPPPQPNRRAASIDPNLGCHGVGPIGCGTNPLPVVTISSDGKVRIGAPDGEP